MNGARRSDTNESACVTISGIPHAWLKPSIADGSVSEALLLFHKQCGRVPCPPPLLPSPAEYQCALALRCHLGH